MSSLVNTICSMDNDEYKDSIIKDYTKYGFDDISVFEIIKSMGDSAIKNIIENHTLYSFTDRDLVKIVNLIDDVSYKEKIISNYKYYSFDKEDIAFIISSFPDEDKKEYVVINNKYYLNSYCRSIIIDSIKDESYKYSIITKYKDYGLSSFDVSYIISGFKNKDEYIFRILSNYKEYCFDLSFLSNIVSLMSDTDKEKIVMDNKFGFDTLSLCNIISSFSDEFMKDSILSKLYDKGVFGDNKLVSNICLPSEMTIGIEIESEGENSRKINTKMLPSGWDIHLETTLNKGTEIVSPILHSGDEKEISKVCSLLNSLGQYVSGNCAGHIHIGASYFDNVDSFKVLLEMFSNLEGILFLISNNAGDIPREKAFKYAIPITSKIASKNIDFDNVNDVESFSLNIHNIQDMYSKPRYSSINFENLNIPLQNTIEFRTPNGTLDPNVWITNINLFGGLMVASRNISLALKKSYDDMTDDDKRILYFYEKIKDINISDRDRLVCFLNLLPSSIEKNVYLDRYEVNSELVKGLQTCDILDTISVFRPIKITTCSDELKEKVIDGYKDYVKSNVSIR